MFPLATTFSQLRLLLPVEQAFEARHSHGRSRHNRRRSPSPASSECSAEQGDGEGEDRTRSAKKTGASTRRRLRRHQARAAPAIAVKWPADLADCSSLKDDSSGSESVAAESPRPGPALNRDEAAQPETGSAPAQENEDNVQDGPAALDGRAACLEPEQLTTEQVAEMQRLREEVRMLRAQLQQVGAEPVA